MLVEKLGVRAANCTTATARLPGGAIGGIAEFEAAQAKAYPQIASIGHLGRLYGAQLSAVLGLAKDRPEMLAAIGTTGDIAAQIVHAVREEMALSLEDVVMRRTCIGGLGPPPPEALDSAARITGEECSWDETRRQSETLSVMRNFRTREEA